MPFIDLGKYAKINSLKKFHYKRKEGFENTLNKSGALVLPEKVLRNIPESSNNKEQVVMVVPTALRPAREIKFGLLFIAAASILLALFTLFAYFGIRHYRKMLNSKRREMIDLEVNLMIKDEAVHKNSNTHIAQSQSDLNLSKNNPSNVLNRPNRNLMNSPWMGKSNLDKSAENIPEKPPNSYQSNTFLGPRYTTTRSADIIPLNYQQKGNKQSLKNHLNQNTENNYLSRAIPGSLRTESNSLSAFINCKTEPPTPVTKRKKKVHRHRKSNRITYTKHELVDLEPVQTYQLLEHCYNDGDFLVTDLVYSDISLLDGEPFETKLSDLTEMRKILVNHNTPPAVKILELFRFVSVSSGMKNYENPIVFTLPYGLLIDTVINFNLVSTISDSVPLILKSAYVETAIMYCISCWKYEKIKSNTIETFFKRSNEELYIPPKLKLYEFIITLMSQGFRNNLLEEVLIFFSLAPSPHLLPNVINQSKVKRTATLNRLFKYILKQVQQEHYMCCANTAKWKHWELTTSGVQCPIEESSSFDDTDHEEMIDYQSFKENCFKELQENIQSFDDNKWKHEITGKSNVLGISDENENKRGRENIIKDNVKNPVLTSIPRIFFGAASVLPGSLSPSPT